MEQGLSNAQYTLNFSSQSLLIAIDSWIDSNLIANLQASQFFSIMADECHDISTQEELSVYCRWVVNGHAEEHFMTILHIKSLDAEAITAAITTYLESKILSYRKQIGQGYDGASPFSGKCTGVKKTNSHTSWSCNIYALLLPSIAVSIKAY